MKSATISQAKNHLSELLARVKRGETVLILERDRPIARIVPLGDTQLADDGRLADLERRGVLRRAPRGPLRKLPPPIDWPAEADLVAALLSEREDARY
jgi:prevent-host-death family protein